MISPRTIQETLSLLPRKAPGDPLPRPAYSGLATGPRVAFAVPSSQHYVSDEAWQQLLGLVHAGYTPTGYLKDQTNPLPLDLQWVGTDTGMILQCQPPVLFLGDRRDWEGQTAGPGFDRREFFTNTEVLKYRPDVFKVMVLKDAHWKTGMYRQWSEDMGVHAWVTPYHPSIAAHLCPFVRPKHLIRTYHTVDADRVPPYEDRGNNSGLHNCVLPGFLHPVYPLRQRIKNELSHKICWFPHPGYHRTGCHTGPFLQMLSKFRVAICTSSIYGYAVRKIIEATACGCRVVTDLPSDDVLPEIDGNLVRIPPSMPTDNIRILLDELVTHYDPSFQEDQATKAKRFYDYRNVGLRLSEQIDNLRGNYQ